jgi:hypothetical protein
VEVSRSRRSIYAIVGLFCGLFGGSWLVGAIIGIPELGHAIGTAFVGFVFPLLVIAAGSVLLNTAIHGRRPRR